MYDRDDEIMKRYEAITDVIAHRTRVVKLANPGLSEADAMSQVFRDEPALYQRYRRLSLAAAATTPDGPPLRQPPLEDSISAQVVKAAMHLGEGNFERGLRLVQKAMPELWRDYLQDYAR
jgi:hypothetical protein